MVGRLSCTHCFEMDGLASVKRVNRSLRIAYSMAALTVASDMCGTHSGRRPVSSSNGVYPVMECTHLLYASTIFIKSSVVIFCEITHALFIAPFSVLLRRSMAPFVCGRYARDARHTMLDLRAYTRKSELSNSVPLSL